MPRVTLDSSFVRHAVSIEGRSKTDYYDVAITGFILEVRSTGGKTYSLRYRDTHGVQRQHKIGDARSISFDRARQAAQVLRSRVTLGENPAEDRKVLRTVPTIAGVVEEKYIPFIKRYRRNYESTLSFLRIHVLPKFGAYHLDELKADAISQAHSGMRDQGYSAAMSNLLPIRLRAIYNYSRKLKLPGSAINPANDVQLFSVSNARERFLSQDEIGRLRNVLAQSENPQLRYIVPLLLLLGCRKRELLDARWEHVDFERRTLFVPLSKSGHSRFIPLSSAVIDILNQLPRWDKCPWVVPNPKSLKPYVSIYFAWNTARRRAGIPEVRCHDLRHTAASHMVQSNVPIYTVAKVLGHTQVKTAERYSHLGDDSLLAAAETISQSMGSNWAEAQKASAPA